MHLLVLGAFRLRNSALPSSSSGRLNAPSGAWCFPTDFLRTTKNLTDGLNAPSGAWCFPTSLNDPNNRGILAVSMHLLVLGAFRPGEMRLFQYNYPSQCTFWCLVLSDLPERSQQPRDFSCLNAPSGAWCFPTGRRQGGKRFGVASVSMHLLVLSAFRPRWSPNTCSPPRLNSPFGAWCFPTLRLARLISRVSSLNAPSGAWCFPTPPPENSATTPLTEAKSPPT